MVGYLSDFDFAMALGYGIWFVGGLGSVGECNDALDSVIVRA